MMAKGMKVVKDSRGFTLMELIIVITILAILVTLAMLYYGNLTDDARRNALLADLDAVDKAVALYQNKYNELPVTSTTTTDLATEIANEGTTGLPAILSETGFVNVFQISGGNSNFMDYIKRTTYLLKPGSESGDSRGHGKLYYVDSAAEIDNGTATAGAAGTITIENEGRATDFYIGAIIYITDGTGVGQSRTITDYNDVGFVVTVTPNWDITPDGTSEYSIVPPVKKGDLVFLQTAATETYKINDANGNIIYK